MGLYTITPDTNYKKWIQLSSFIDKQHLNRIITKNILKQRDCLNEENYEDENFNFTKIELKKSFLKSNIGSEITRNYLDKTLLLSNLLQTSFKGKLFV